MFTLAANNAHSQEVKRAANESESLHEVIVSAARAPQEWRQTSSSVSVISMADLETMQIPDLKTSLQQESGVNVITTGAVGGGTAVYIRGAYPHHTLFIVDGVRMNDRSASYNNFMGGSGAEGIDRIEILRGAQSPMYGSAAMGGVILMNTSKGSETLGGNAALSGGSFDSYSGSMAATGSAGDLGFSASATRYHTANEQPANDYDSESYSARLNYDVSESWEVGATYRGQQATFQSPGSRFVTTSQGVVDSENTLATAYAEWQASATVNSKFTVGYHQRKYDWTDRSGTSKQTNEREIFEWQTAWTPSNALSVVVGANYEQSEYDINSSLSEDEILAGFLSGTYQITDTLTFTAGIRRDDFESVGSAFTWRSGVAWMVLPDTKVRATYGTGFAAPGSSDRYGVPAFGQLPNPDLRPEESKGWDLGVDQSFMGGALTLSATYFDNRFKDLIDWSYVDLVTDEGMYINRSKASTSGVEFGITARPVDSWNVRFGYTYLDGRDEGTDKRLTRRPRNSFDASTWFDITDQWTVGLGVRGMYDRLDTPGPLEDYNVARAFTSYQLGQNLSIKARVENLLDEKYDEVYGYAALSRGYYGSVEWKF
ncbi:TonB-dependent receptor plug domain-containing protein [Povalibacter sp.]|uniref:TonB-dependent receptor plug domain-containing protein n=1 Tax=Povalibacter sp. TaxID=1962978 RepID=UPI002F3FFD72